MESSSPSTNLQSTTAVSPSFSLPKKDGNFVNRPDESIEGEYENSMAFVGKIESQKNRLGFSGYKKLESLIKEG